MIQKLEEKIKDWNSPLSVQDRLNTSPRLATNSCLAWRRPMNKLKGTLSVKVCAEREITWKLNYLRLIKGVWSIRKKIQLTHRNNTIPETQSSLIGKTLFLCLLAHFSPISISLLLYPHQSLKYKASHDNERLNPIVGSLASSQMTL